MRKQTDIKEKLIIGGILSSPLVLLGINFLLGIHFEHQKKPFKPPYESYEYTPRVSDTSSFKGKPIRHLDLKTNRGGNTTLYINGVTISTNMEPEAIMQQLNMDYQDLFDYYGGAEELY